MDSIDIGLKQILEYFSDPTHHTDKDAQHISQDELFGTRGDLPNEAMGVVKLIYANRDAYYEMTEIQSEGIFNDGELSLRDLYAITRGTGYDKENIATQLALMKSSLFKIEAEQREQARIAEAAQAKFESDVQKIVDEAVELDESRSYKVRIKMRKDDFGLDWKNELKATYENLVVDGRTYDKWRVGQVISSQSDPIGAMTGDSGWLTTYNVSVSSKTCTKEHSYRDASGNHHPIQDEKIYDEAKKQLVATGKVVEFESPDFYAAYVLPDGLKEADIVSREPLTRHFVTLKIQSNSFSLSLTKHMRNAATAHHIEIEIPPSAGEGAVEFEQGINGANYILSRRLSHMSGEIVSRRTETDQSYELLTLTDGRQIVAAKNRNVE